MSLPVWPEGLPHKVRRDGFDLMEPHLPPLETEFEGGAYRRRPSSTLRRARLALTWRWLPSEYDIFRRFYHLTLAEGSARFTLAIYDGLAGAHVATICQFAGMYSGTQPDRFWRVSAEILAFGGPPLPEPEPEPGP